MDLGDVGSFLSGITNDVTSAFKTFNAPTSTPLPGAAVPGRPGYVYGAGGAIFPVNPATGLPVTNSTPVGGTSKTTLILIALIGILGGAFLFSFRK